MEALECRRLLTAASSFDPTSGEFRIAIEDSIFQTTTTVDTGVLGGLTVLTINGEAPRTAAGAELLVSTSDVRRLVVIGTLGNNDIDVFAVSKTNFPFIDNVEIDSMGLGSVLGIGDLIVGSQVEDAIILRRGIRSIDGNDGDDLLQFHYRTPAQANVTIGAESISGNNLVSFDFTTPLSDIETIQLLPHEANAGLLNLDAREFRGGLSIIGTEFDDTILAGEGNDTLFGEGGPDSIVGGGGNDDIKGGDGNDTIDGGMGNDTIQGGLDRDMVQGGDGNDVLAGLFTQSAALDTQDVDAAGDLVDGNNGDDRLEGTPGNDTLVGGDGDDTMAAGLGNDILRFSDVVSEIFETDFVTEFSDGLPAPGGGFDTLDFSGESFGVEMAADSSALTTFQREVRLTNLSIGDRFEAVIGTDDDDVLVGFRGNRMRLEGRGGHDKLTARFPGTELDGGPGDDEFIFLPSLLGDEEPHVVTDSTGEMDVLNFMGFNRPVAVDLTGGSSRTDLATLPNDENQKFVETKLNLANFEKVIGSPFDDVIEGTGDPETLVGGLGNDLIMSGRGRGADLLIGDLEDLSSKEGGRDVLIGSQGNDTLMGGPANDYLLGNDGRDTLNGNGGQDLFPDLGSMDSTDAEVDGFVNFEASPLIVKPRDVVSYKFEVQNTASAKDAISGPTLVVDRINVEQSFTKATGLPFPEAQFPHLPLGFPRDNALYPGQTKEESGTGIAGAPGIGTTVATVTAREPDGVPDNNQIEKDIFIFSGAAFALQFGFFGAFGGVFGGFFGGLINGRNGVVLGANGGGNTSSYATTGDQPSKFPDNDRHALANSGAGVFIGQGFLDPFGGAGGLNLGALFGDPVRVDVTEDGIAGEQNVRNLVITPDGEFVAFATPSALLSPVPDNNRSTDIFRKNMLTGELEIVTVNSDGSAAGNDGSSSRIAMSPDGRFLAFTSAARDLVDGYTKNAPAVGRDLFLRDMETGVTRLVTTSASDDGSGTQGANDGSASAVFSPDGRFLIFDSNATDLVEGYVAPDGNRGDLFIYDLVTEETRLVSGAANGLTGGNSFHAFIDPTVGVTEDHLRVVFATSSNNLQTALPDDENSRVLVREYVREPGTGNLQAGVTRAVSLNHAGTEVRDGQNPSVTPDGRFVVFTSSDPDLTSLTHTSDSNTDVFLTDLDTGVTELISVNLAGTDAGDRPSSARPDLSDDGRYVAFASDATDLADFVKGTVRERDVFVRDRLRGETVLLSLNASGTASGNEDSTRPLISGDGTTVGFESEATDLIAEVDDRNGNGDDVFFSSRHVQPLVFLPEADDTVTVRRNGDLIELFSDNDNAVIFSREVEDIIGLVVNGTDAGNDTLVFDYTGGTLGLERGVTFNAGVGGNDSLVLRNGSFDRATYQVAGVDSGFVHLQNGTTESITYTGLEPVVDETTAAHRTFQTFLGDIETLLPIDATIRVSDGGNATDALLSIDDGGLAQFESHMVAVPTDSLTIEGGFGNDTIRIDSLDMPFQADLILRGRDGNDTIDSSTVSQPVKQEGGRGDDTLVSGAGNDSLDGGLGTDQLSGGNGNDQLTDSDARATFAGDTGIDVIVPQRFGRLDFTGNLTGSTTLEQIESRGQGQNQIVLDLGSVREITGADNTLFIFADEELDSIDLGDGFLETGRETIGGLNFTVFQQEDATVNITFDEGVFNLKPWSNPQILLDVNGDGLVTAVGDVLPTINELNTAQFIDETGRLPVPPPISPPPFFFDTNGDGFLTAVGDVLPLINFINQNPDGEGESSVFANDLPLLATKAAGWYAGKTAAFPVDRWFVFSELDLRSQVELTPRVRSGLHVDRASEPASQARDQVRRPQVANHLLEALDTVFDETQLAEELDLRP